MQNLYIYICDIYIYIINVLCFSIYIYIIDPIKETSYKISISSSGPSDSADEVLANDSVLDGLKRPMMQNADQSGGSALTGAV